MSFVILMPKFSMLKRSLKNDNLNSGRSQLNMSHTSKVVKGTELWLLWACGVWLPCLISSPKRRQCHNKKNISRKRGNIPFQQTGYKDGTICDFFRKSLIQIHHSRLQIIVTYATSILWAVSKNLLHKSKLQNERHPQNSIKKSQETGTIYNNTFFVSL